MASIDKVAKGYRARWRTPDGASRSRTFTRKADAERWLTSVEHSKLTSSYVDRSAGRVGFATYARLHLDRQPWRASTAAPARRCVARAIAAWADRPIVSMQSFVAGLTDLSPSTVGLVMQHVRAVFAAAARDRPIVRSPAQGVRLPRMPARQVRPPTDEEVRALLDGAAPSFRAAIVLGAGLGLRHSEAAGLTVDRVDFLRRQVTLTASGSHLRKDGAGSGR